MEPFSKDDPLHKLLGKCRVAEPRPNFTQNVLRAARQQPQQVGFWERCRAWLEEEGSFRKLNHGILAAAAVLTLSLVVWKQAGTGTPTGTSADVVTNSAPAKSLSSLQVVETVSAVDMPVEAVVASELESLDHLSVMLAQQNTSAMTDSEIASLLY